MKNLIILLSLLLLVSCSANRKNKNRGPFYKIEILQDGKIIPPENGIIELEKAAFQYQVKMRGTEGIYLANSFDRYYFDIPDDESMFGRSDYGYKFLGGKCMAELPFNEEKELYMCDQNGISYWFYDRSEDWHRFDKGVKEENGFITAKKTVEKLYIDEENVLNVSNNEQDIYIISCLRASEDRASDQFDTDIQRKKLILKFK